MLKEFHLKLKISFKSWELVFNKKKKNGAFHDMSKGFIFGVRNDVYKAIVLKHWAQASDSKVFKQIIKS